MRHFTLIVAGENPEEMVKKYDSNLKVEPYVAYEFKKASEYKRKYLEMYKSCLESMPDDEKEYAQNIIKHIEKQSDIDFYIELTEDYDLDEETGDAISDKNKDGKYDICRLGKELSMPLKDMMGKETFKERKSEIDWGAIHLNNQYVYNLVWEMCMEGRVPSNHSEEQLYEKMMNRKEYFSTFGNKDTYVTSNTAFWGYAFLSDKTGWVELDKNTDQNEWVGKFYERFIKKLPDDTLISVWECVRNDF